MSDLGCKTDGSFSGFQSKSSNCEGWGRCMKFGGEQFFAWDFGDLSPTQLRASASRIMGCQQHEE